MNEVQDWAIANKHEVHELAQKYSGSFVRCLIDAFLHADITNTRKILTNWPAEFAQLYKFKKRAK